MAPHVGSIAFWSVRFETELKKPAATIETFRRTGFDGLSWRNLGKAGVPVRFLALIDVTAANKQATIIAAASLLDSVVEVEEDDGTVWQKIKVLSIDNQRAEAVRGSVGGLNPGAAEYLLGFALVGVDISGG